MTSRRAVKPANSTRVFWRPSFHYPIMEYVGRDKPRFYILGALSMCLLIKVNVIKLASSPHELRGDLVKPPVYDACFNLFNYNKRVVLFMCVLGCCLYTAHFLTGKHKMPHSFSIQHVNKRHFWYWLTGSNLKCTLCNWRLITYFALAALGPRLLLFESD